MSAFELAATALLAGFVPLGVVAVRGRPIDGVVALMTAGVLTTLVLLCFAEAFHRPFEYGLAVVAAVMSWAGGLVFARFLGRWL